MDILSVVIACSLTVLLSVTIVSVYRWLDYKKQLFQQQTQKTAELLVLEEQIKHFELERSEMQAITGLKSQEINDLKLSNDDMRRKFHDKDKEVERLSMHIKQLEAQQALFDDVKKQHIEAAKISINEMGRELSNKLLDDHKRETQQHHQQQEKRLGDVTAKVHQQFDKIVDSVSVLNNKVKRVEVVEKALLSPSGAGQMAETTLANLFKSSSLVEKQDYMMQYWLKDHNGAGLKPDAVVFLPDEVMVIDSKASKFFIELANASNQDETNRIEQGIKKTMHEHLKALISKNYRQAIDSQVNHYHQGRRYQRVTMYMFLPTESAVEHLRRIDSNFEAKAWEQNILVVGPTGLKNSLLHAEMHIMSVLQQQNSQQILSEVKKLLLSIGKMHELSDGLGKSIKSSCDKYDRFAASFNRNFLAKVRKIENLGASTGKVMEHLPRYQIIAQQETIEAKLVDDIADDVTSLSNKQVVMEDSDA